jgi:hypothetical protein
MAIAGVLDLSWVHGEFAPYYPKLGRPSIDPALMIRMLVIGYVFAIRLERARHPPASALPTARSALCGRLQAPGAVGRGRPVPSAGRTVFDAVTSVDRGATVHCGINQDHSFLSNTKYRRWRLFDRLVGARWNDGGK